MKLLLGLLGLLTAVLCLQCTGNFQQYQNYILFQGDRSQHSYSVGLLTLARRACAAKGYCSRSVCRFVRLSVCPHVFSRTVAAVDTKPGHVGMCNGRSAQQESGTS